MTSSNKILIVNNLKKYYPVKRSFYEIITFRKGKYVRAVDNICFSVNDGEVYCLVGESGCGKTTTGRLVAKLIEPTSGNIKYRPRDDLLKLSYNAVTPEGFVEYSKLPRNYEKLFRREVQIIFQDPYGSLDPRQTIFSTLEEPLLVHKIGNSSKEREELIFKILEEVKLTPPEEFINRYPHMLSGGQRQRVNIARALILKPKLVVADEPVSMLDVSVRAEILQLMMDLKVNRNLTYIFITHDLAVAGYICDRVAVMYLGKIVEEALTTELVNDPLHPYTKALISAVPEPNPSNRFRFKDLPIYGEVPSAIQVPKGCRFHPRCPYVMDICRSEEPPLTEIRSGHSVACWLYANK
ncbi:MAG: ABC transporter ATP-binding protein [Sulfolobales archaeon]